MTALRVVFAWENLGPSHFDRLAACAADPGLEVTAIDFFGTSTVYDWSSAGPTGLRRLTLYPNSRAVHRPMLAWRLLRACLSVRPHCVFLCHYNYLPVFVVAIALRLLGIRIVTMIDSKFDDMDRFIWREISKALLLSPYRAALAGSRRTVEYLRFLGFRKRRVEEGFDTLDVARISRMAQTFLERPSPPHKNRDFLIVARLIQEKNIEFALRAFAEWREQSAHTRRLRIIGAGPLEESLRFTAEQLGLVEAVLFEGARTPDEVALAMQESLALLFPSVQETFGFVVIEALALGLPVLISSKPGAVDSLIDNAVNGWVFDPFRPAGLIAAMHILDRDESAWKSARAAAIASSTRGDVRHFVRAVQALSQPA